MRGADRQHRQARCRHAAKHRVQQCLCERDRRCDEGQRPDRPDALRPGAVFRQSHM